MDVLVEDVSRVMNALDSHGATELVNVNTVFERLESYNSSKCQGEELVNKVVTSFLIELGLAPPLSDSPEVQIVDEIESNGAPGPSTVNGASGPSTLKEAAKPSTLPSSSVRAVDSNTTVSAVPSHSKGPPAASASSSKALAYDSNMETVTLSPGLCQAFNEPYSPLVSYPSSPEEGKEEKDSSVTIVSTSLSSGPSTGAIPKVKQCVSSTRRTSPDLLTNSEAMETNSNLLSKNSCEDLTSSKASVSSPSKRESDVLEPSESTISAKKLKSSPNSPKMKASPGRSPGVNSDQGTSDKAMDVQTVGGSHASWRNTGSKVSKAADHVKTLSEMFPEADPQYLWDRAEQIENNDELSTLIEYMLTTDDYPRVFQSNKSFRNGSAAAGSANGFFNSTPEFHDFSKPSTSTASVVKTEPSSSAAVVKSEPSSSASANLVKSEPLSSAQVTKASSSKVTAVDNRAIASTSKASGFVNKPVTVVSSLSEAKRRMSLESSSASSSAETDTAAAAAPPREPWQDQHEIFLQIFPDADPSYLEEKARALHNKEEELKVFVAELLEKREYPSRKDWVWRQEQLALQKKYSDEFCIPNFLEIIPDPFAYFTDATRKCSNPDQASMFLRNKYRKLRVADITSTFKHHGHNLTLTCRTLNNWTGATLKGRRNSVEYDIKKSGGQGIDVPFLQEIAFIENEPKIVEYLEAKKKRREDAFNEAKAKGELLQCQCCYDDEVLAEDIRNCSEGHLFCISCLQKSSEQRIGDGQTTFPCLEDCSAEFSLQMLQEILKPTVFSRLVQRKQAEEVKAAGIEDLVQCPFCDFCNIPPKDDKVFRCLNPECMKESCRLCKDESHVPLRCEEVEKKSEVEMRTYIENKMTEALVRTCWKCNRKFVKEDGCNKMRCQCGALMCYVCRQPVKDYSHFNGQGGDNFDRCPLWSNNDDLHVHAVAKVAEAAKQEALAQNPETKLVHDPTLVLPEAKGQRDRPLGAAHPAGAAPYIAGLIAGLQPDLEAVIRRVQGQFFAAPAHGVEPRPPAPAYPVPPFVPPPEVHRAAPLFRPAVPIPNPFALRPVFADVPVAPLPRPVPVAPAPVAVPAAPAPVAVPAAPVPVAVPAAPVPVAVPAAPAPVAVPAAPARLAAARPAAARPAAARPAAARPAAARPAAARPAAARPAAARPAVARPAAARPAAARPAAAPPATPRPAVARPAAARVPAAPRKAAAPRPGPAAARPALPADAARPRPRPAAGTRTAAAARPAEAGRPADDNTRPA